MAESQKRRRYDRQLRMWGEHGQEALERCKLCLVNGSATGTETLKNLVLPGIGSFTVVDGAVVTARDLGNNFFLDESHIGRPRAECVTAMLQELNEHVRGSYVNDDVTALLESNPFFLDEFTIVAATQLPEPALRRLALACAARSIPLVNLRAYGLAGLVRVAAGEHVVAEGHPDNTPSDLRVCAPFPELLAYAESRFGGADSLSANERKHIPYVVLLMQAVQAYKDGHGGALPSTYREKQAVKALLSAQAEKWFGVLGAEDAINFEEAKAAVNTALAPPSVPGDVRAVLEAAQGHVEAMRPSSEDATSPSSVDANSASNRTFWILAAALQRFVNGEGKGALPLLGTVPDMTADTSSFVQLSGVYRDRAQAEAEAVHAHVQSILTGLGHPASWITLDQTRSFCKNAHTIQWLRYRSFEDEYTPATARVKHIASLMDEGPAASFYLLLRAADAFHSQYNRFPGAMDNDIESDVPLLKQCAHQLLAELRTQASTPLAIRDDLVVEMCRYGAAEIHSVAAIVGGVGSQEIIKLLTSQFVPLNNLYVYNGLDGTSITAEV